MAEAERLLLLPSDLLRSDECNESGFVLGWSSTEKSSQRWHTPTTVVAGVVDVQKTTDIAREYSSLKQKIGILKEMLEKKALCVCNSGRLQTVQDEETKIGQDFKVVAYFSRKDKANDNTAEEWRKQAGLSRLESKNGRLEWDADPSTPSRDKKSNQILFYDPKRVYRHKPSEPSSSFGFMLQQLTIANCIVEFVSTLPSADVANSKVKTGSYTPNSNNQQSQNIEKRTWQWIEKHCFFAHHLQSMQQRDSLHWAPAARIWRYYRKLDALRERCYYCHKTRILQTKVPQLELTNQLISDAMDLLLGLLFGLLLVGKLGGSSILPYIFSFYTEQQFLPEWLHWLESFPIGFKLNVALTHAIGKEIRSLVILRQNVLSVLVDFFASWGFSPALRLLAPALTTALGGSGCLAILSDVTHLLTLHLDLLSNGFRHMYSTEIYLLGTSWRLFRGKKQNILRQRTDTMEYDSMQLLLGSILFAMTLFLLTTILVYYIFFTLLNLIVGLGSLVVLGITYTMIQDFPFGMCYFRLLYPEMFCSLVVISDPNIKQPASPHEYPVMLEPVPESLGAILRSQAKLMASVQGLSSCLGAMGSGIFSGQQTSKSVVESLACFYSP